MHVEIRKGKLGKYRFVIMDEHGEARAVSPVNRSFITYDEAMKDAQSMLDSHVEVVIKEVQKEIQSAGLSWYWTIASCAISFLGGFLVAWMATDMAWIEKLWT